MGGDGTWALAMHARQRLAAIAPLCGGGDVHKVKRLLNLPIWNFHGGQDTEVALAESEVLIQALRRSGSKNLRFTVYPNAGHDIWTRTYSNPELYTWLLSQQNPLPRKTQR